MFLSFFHPVCLCASLCLASSPLGSWLCRNFSHFLSSFMFVRVSLSGQFPSQRLALSQLLSLSFILHVCARLFVWPVPLSAAGFVAASLTFFADPTNAFRFSTLELDYTLPKEKEKNGIAASADPPRRSKKARTQPKSELSALPPPSPPRRCPGCALCTVTAGCAGMPRAT